MNVTFRTWDCRLDIKRYSNGRPALLLRDSLTGEPVAVCTVNVPEAALDRDEIIIKDYAENDGVLNTLVAADLVFLPHRFVTIGHGIQVPVCQITTILQHLIQEQEQ